MVILFSDKIIVTLFLGDKTKSQYKPGTVDQLAEHIVRAVGPSGTNLEYVYQVTGHFLHVDKILNIVSHRL